MARWMSWVRLVKGGEGERVFQCGNGLVVCGTDFTALLIDLELKHKEMYCLGAKVLFLGTKVFPGGKTAGA